MDEILNAVNGVFLHSRNLDSEFMVKCLQVLVNIFPELRITSIESDELHFGFRVYFSQPNAKFVLLRKHLIVSGEEVRIGPLRTILTIHGVRLNGGEQYDAELKQTICNKFGKLLKDVRVSNSVTFLQVNVQACVDVPELEDLEIFRNEMFICLPSNNEALTVTFHCRRCDKDGHGLQNCPQTLHDETSMTDFSGDSNPSFRRHSFTFLSENRDEETRSNQDFGSTARHLQGVFPNVSHNTAGPSLGNLDTPLEPPTRSAFPAPTSTAATGNTQTPSTSAAAEVPNTPPTPTNSVLDTRNLSPRLQRYIDIACEEINVIDRHQLNNYFHQVKKKSKIVEYAKRVTCDVGGLITQLQRIITLYYSRTETDTTKEDERFINRLVDLVEKLEKNIVYLRESGEMV